MRYSYQRVPISFGGPTTRAVRVLLILNVAVFFCQAIARHVFAVAIEPFVGLVPYLVVHKAFVWQLVTYMFLHAGLLHLGFNLLAIWMFGCDLERVWGTRFFVKYYFVSGIGESLCALAVSPQSPIPTIGASGAVYGILLAYGLLFPQRQILLWFAFPIKARHFVILIGLLACYFSLTSSERGITDIAHLGGLAAGYLYLRGWWKLRRLKRRYRVVHGGKDTNHDRYVN